MFLLTPWVYANNLLVNGDFETGDVTGWITVGAASRTYTDPSGIRTDGIGLPLGGWSLNGGSIEQTVETVVSDIYALSFDAGSTHGAIINGNILEVYINNVLLTTIDDNTNDGLTTHILNYIATDTNTTIKFVFTGNTSSPDTDFDIDNIRFELLPDDYTFREDFESTVSDWSNNTTRSTYGSDTYLGGFGNTGRVTADTQRVFSVPEGAQRATISFDFLEIDSWDGEHFYVYIDGHQIDLGRFYMDRHYGVSADQTASLGDNLVQNGDFESHPSLNHGGWGTFNSIDGWSASQDVIEIQLGAHSGTQNPSNLKLGFGSSLNQSSRDESWGVDNLLISTNTSAIILDTDFESGASGWANNTTKNTNAGDAYLGGYGNTNTVSADTEQIFTVPSGAQSVNIAFDFLSIDSWDGERFYVYVDDQQLDLGRFYMDSHYGSRSDLEISGSQGDISWTVSDNNESIIGGAGRSDYWGDDEKHRVTISVNSLEQNAVVELDAYANATLSQIVTIPEAGTYQFSIDYAMRGTDISTNGMSISIDGVLQQSVYPSVQGFQTLIFDVALDAGSSRIDIAALGRSDGYGTLIDNVSLQKKNNHLHVGDQIISWSVSDTGAAILGGAGRSDYWGDDEKHEVTITMTNPRDQLTLGFGSSLNQSSRDESWGVDNLVVYFCCSTHTTPAVSYFTIDHDSAAAYCLAEPISVIAYDDQSEVVDTYTGTITLDTQTGSGTWSLSSGAGTFLDAASDDGLATYTFAASDAGRASFTVYYTNGNNHIDVDVYDGSVRDNDTEGRLQFAASGFSITASALVNPPPIPIDDPIAAKVSGQSFILNVAAHGLDPNNGECGIIETYAGSKTLAVSAQYINPAAGTMQVAGGGVVSFTNGQASMPVQYDDAGQIAVNITDNADGITGQSNPFVVKPANFSVDVTGNPATTSTGAGLVAAGENFTVNVQALNALGNVTPNYGNEISPESVTLALDSLVFPSGGQVGVLNNPRAFTKVSGGVFQNASVSWSEVGSIRLVTTVADGDYMGAGNVTSAASGVIGRFYPYHFNLGVNSVTDACLNFTYLSQPELSISYTLTALNADGATTTNYDQGLSYPVAALQYHAELGDNASDLGSRLSTQSSTWSAGEYTLVDSQAALSRGASLEAPMSDLVLGLSVNDVDSRQFSSMTMNPLTTGDCVEAGNCTASELGSATFYFGRLLLNDAYGPETAVLPVKFRTEYWDGQQFVINDGDNCTVIERDDISFNDVPITTADALNVDLSGGSTAGQFGLLNATTVGFLGGDAVFSFSAPGVAIQNHSFSIDVDLTDIDWLRFDWNQDGNHENDSRLPTATISFKTYRGHDRILYWRHKL